MASSPSPRAPAAAPSNKPGAEVPFGANEMRLNRRHWTISLAILVILMGATPRLWPRIEPFETGADYRIPYELSRDYWLYARRLGQISSPQTTFVLGDSVVWGEYVRPDGTLSHFLNRESGETNRFVNAGVNGAFPLALEGLVRYYGQALHHRKVLLHGNVLWMTSPKADLSTDKEESFNHATLVPQFIPRIPCYRASAEERLSAIVSREFNCLSWVAHLQDAYFGQKSIPKWTLEDDGSDPPHYPNAYRNPLAQLTFRLPTPPNEDPDRGPRSPRHKPWSTSGRATTQFDWVRPESSLQWQAFQRVVALLRERGNDVFVLLGPFNEHMLTEDNRPTCRHWQETIASWLAEHQVPHLLPPPLPSTLYADASHPLTDGYAQLAREISQDPGFQSWLDRRQPERANARNHSE